MSDPTLSTPPAVSDVPPKQLASVAAGATGSNEAARGALAMLMAVLLVQLGISVLSSLARAYMMSGLHGRSDSISATLAVVGPLLAVVSLGYMATQVVLIVALLRLARGAVTAESSLRLAATLAGVKLAVSMVSNVAPTAAVRLGIDHILLGVMYQVLGVFDMVVIAIGSALLLESLLRLRARPEGNPTDATARALFWGLLVLRFASGYLPSLSSLLALVVGVGFTGVLEQATYWIGMVLNVGYTVFMVAMCRAAALTLAQDPNPATTTAAQPDPLDSTARAAGLRNILYGSLWLAGGLAVTLLTYSTASRSGGRYVMAYGAIVGGAIQLLRGVVQLLSSR